MNGLKYIRKAHGMTLAALGKRMGITKQTISQWEQGTYSIPNSRLNELSVSFGLPEHYFLDVKESDIEELDALIKTVKAQAEESYLFSEYENLLKAERQTISKIDRYLKGKDNEQETFQDLTYFMEREIKRFEKLLDVLSNPNFRFLLDPILDVFISQGNAGADRTELIKSLKKEITAVLDDAEQTAKENKWPKEHKEEFDELF